MLLGKTYTSEHQYFSMEQKYSVKNRLQLATLLCCLRVLVLFSHFYILVVDCVNVFKFSLKLVLN